MEILHTAGKINIFLRMTGIRGDGYHELYSLFMPIPEPWDELRLRRTGGGRLKLWCETEGIDLEHNTLVKAHNLYGTASGFTPGLEVNLVKGIPHGAGLGGGSADAGLLLNWLERHAPVPLGRDKLISLAAKVGADVPFFLRPEPCVALGIGDELYPVRPDLDWAWVVLVCPSLRVNTAEAFAAWDEGLKRKALTLWPKPDKNHRSYLRRGGDFPVSSVDNGFEPVVFTMCPELARLKGRLFREGAACAGLSGSGSALFGMFREREGAASAAESMSRAGAAGELSVFGPFRFGTCGHGRIQESSPHPHERHAGV